MNKSEVDFFGKLFKPEVDLYSEININNKWITSSQVTEYLVEKRSFKSMWSKKELRSIHITLQHENYKVARIYIEEKVGTNSFMIRRLDDGPTKVRVVETNTEVIGYLLNKNDTIEGPMRNNFKDVTKVHEYFQISPPDANINKIKRHNNVLCFDG